MKLKNSIIILFLLVIIILCLYYSINKNIERLTSIPIIPLHIYQTWKTKTELPDKMYENINRLKEQNPDFEYHLFDDNDCYNFIIQNFDEDVANAYETLIPGAYKADLWRYCILYINGGIYLDIKYSCVGDFNLIQLTDKEYFVKDIDKSGGGIYNAFMICKPRNIILKKTIDKIVDNVKNKFYGYSCFSPTGPLLLHSCFNEQELENITQNGIGICENKCPTKTCICVNGEPILSIYNEYYSTDITENKQERYFELWNQRKIYKE